MSKEQCPSSLPLLIMKARRGKEQFKKQKQKVPPPLANSLLLSGIDPVPGEAKREYSEIAKQQSTNLVFLHHFMVC